MTQTKLLYRSLIAMLVITGLVLAANIYVLVTYPLLVLPEEYKAISTDSLHPDPAKVYRNGRTYYLGFDYSKK